VTVGATALEGMVCAVGGVNCVLRSAGGVEVAAVGVDACEDG
jgi:hypothetical protein